MNKENLGHWAEVIEQIFELIVCCLKYKYFVSFLVHLHTWV